MQKVSEALKYVKGKIADLEDNLQHYTMVEKDKCKEFYIKEDLKQFNNILENLQELQAIKKVNPSEAMKLVDKMWQHLDLECLREIGNDGYNTIKQALEPAEIDRLLLQTLKRLMKEVEEEGAFNYVR